MGCLGQHGFEISAFLFTGLLVGVIPAIAQTTPFATYFVTTATVLVGGNDVHSNFVLFKRQLNPRTFVNYSVLNLTL